MEEQVTQAAVLTVPSSVKGLIEALIFAAEEPLTPKQIKALYDNPGMDGEARSIEIEEIAAIISTLNQEFQDAGKAYRIIRIAGGYQFATLPEYAGWLGKLYREQSRRKLSQSALETLAIIAYKQPITKPEIESIRGVNCDYVLKTLLEKELVTVVGRAETVGRPLLYGTTKEFLRHFGLNDVTDLPRPREIEEILGESQFETERRMLEAQAGAERAKKEEEDFKSRLPHIPRKKPELDEHVEILPRRRTGELKVRKARASGEVAGSPVSQPVEPFSNDAAQTVADTVSDDSTRETTPIPLHAKSSEKTEEIVAQEPHTETGKLPDVRREDQSQIAGDLTQGVPQTQRRDEAPKVDPEERVPVETSAEDKTPLAAEELEEVPTQASSFEEISEQIEDLQQPLHHETILNEVPPPEAGGIVRPTRWQLLKEKIQGFIKKLFA